jgi:cyclohexanecarboxylate-CoA ligase
VRIEPTHLNPEGAAYRDAGHWPGTPLGACFSRSAERHADRDAIIDGQRRLSFRELDRLSQRAAWGFRSLGFGPGDVIAYQLPNWWEAVVVFLGATRIGAIVNPLLPIFRESELRFTLSQSTARALVIPGRFRSCDYRDLVTALQAELPALQTVFVTRDEPPPGMRSLAAFLDTPWERTLHTSALAPLHIDPESVALLMYTSGTTAAPKGVLHTHNTLAAEVTSLERVHQLTPADRTLMPSPLTHISGVIHGILVPALLGTSAVLMERWEPAAALELIAAERVTYMVGAPTFLQDLVAQAQAAPRAARTLRLFSCGGAGVSPALVRDARACFPRCVAKRVYGSTEFPTLTTTEADDALSRGGESEGRPIWPAEVRIASESAAPLPPGCEGEVQGRGPECFVGYLDRGLNADAFTSDGWFRTGDLGVLDDEGYLRITGRLKEIIIRKGEKISVKEVEDLIAAHPAVAEVAVIPRPDPDTGERACAVVRLRPATTIDLASLRAFLAARGLAKQKWPEQLEVVEEFPRTDSGKILRARLKEQWRP